MVLGPIVVAAAVGVFEAYAEKPGEAAAPSKA
jgi:hypothetical protein